MRAWGVLLLLALSSPAFAWGPCVQMIGFGGTGSANNTVDMSRGFEVATASRADSASWVETDTASLLSEQDNGQVYAGAYSLSVVGDNTTAAYVRYDTGDTRASASISHWVYVTASAVDDSPIIGTFAGASVGTYGIRWHFRKTSGAYNFGARGTTLVYGTASITVPAWYRIEVAYAQNLPSSVSVYDTSGALVDTITVTANNNASRYAFIGGIIAYKSNWGKFYFDNLGIDWADATSPLYPFVVAD